MKEYYECHITMKGNACQIEKAIKLYKWKFSSIEGDPDLGKGIKCYATKQFNMKFKKEFIIAVMKETAKEISEISFAKILRKKIEVVIYDERSK